jgi:RHS repeat-associated protein
MNLVSEMDLPDGSKYTFAYETTPGDTHSPHYVTGRLAAVTLPTGGTISYTYSGGSSGHITCSDGSAATLSRQTPDGTWTYARTLVSGTQWQTLVTDPSSSANQTAIQFQGIYETQRKIYQGSTGGTLVQTINTCYNGAASPCTTTAITLPITQRTTNATIPGPGNLQSQHTDKFDNYGNLTETDEYDVAAAAPFPLLRQAVITYATLGNNLNAFRQTAIVKDGSGTIKSRQDTTYDGSSLACVTGAPSHDDAGHGCSFTARANITSVTIYTDPVTPSVGLAKNFTYDSLGNLQSAQLNCCQWKTWSYSSTTGYAYPDAAVIGASPQLGTAMTYDLNMGLMLTSTDPNNVKTTLTYDNMGRPLTSQTGSLPATTYVYHDYDNHSTFTPWTTQVCSPVQGTSTSCQNTILDSLGRTKTAQLLDGTGALYSATDTQYDPFGRAYKTSNPYTSSALYWTQLAFDVLGRLTTTTLPDNSVSSLAYSDNTVTSTDPANVQRKGVSDGLGRLTSLFEPDPSSGNSLTQQTSYSYNTLGQLTQVNQGSQSRSFSYDALGRLSSATTPETGTVCYGTYSGSTCQQNGYDLYNNLLQRTDPRGVVTNYMYDGLNRLVGITYPTVPSGVAPMPNLCKANGAASNNANVCYAYGTTTSSFNNGRLVSTVDPTGSESYTYDQYGNITHLSKTIDTTTYNIGYSYNYGNQVIQTTYPSGRIVVRNLDTVGRLASVVGTFNSVNTTYASGFTYNAAQQTSALKYGNNVYASFGFYPDSLLLQCLDYSTTNRTSCGHDSSTKFGLTYAYPASPGNNGLIASITDAVDNGRSAAYTYDSLYRLTAAVTSGSTGYPKWGVSEVYDRYGNRSDQNQTFGNPPMNHVTIDAAHNRISGSPYAYDSGGNMTNDGANTLVYDGENRTTSATNGGASGTYAYDGKGLRVKKISGGTTTVSVYSGSQIIAEYVNGAAPSSPTNEYIYGTNQKIAAIQSGTTYYFHNDHLSLRVRTDTSGNVADQRGHYPFGETWYSPSGAPLIFTSYYRDAESGNDYAIARYNVSRLGRFASPDQLSGSIFDPQTINRYLYVRDNPVSLIDPFGRECVWDDGSFDSSSDPETGDSGSCGDAGGTWIDLGGSQGDWSPNANQGLADLAAFINTPQSVLVTANADPNVDLSSSPIPGQPSQSSRTTIGPQTLQPSVKHCKLWDVLGAGLDHGPAIGVEAKGFGSKIGVSWMRSAIDYSINAEASAKVLTIGFEGTYSGDPNGDFLDPQGTSTNEFKFGPYRYDIDKGTWSRRKATLSGDLFKTEFGATFGVYQVKIDFDKVDKYIKSHGCDVID